MATAKRLGNTVFSSNDPLDDLRPTKQKKVLTLSKEEPPTVENSPPPVAESVQQASSGAVGPSPAVAEAVEEQGASEPPVMPEQRKAKKGPEGQPEEASPHHKVRFSANVPLALKQRTENAAYWVPGLTISAIVEVALERELRRLEREFNDGRPFEKAGKLKYGRPRGEG